jgi:hypothetical protein
MEETMITASEAATIFPASRRSGMEISDAGRVRNWSCTKLRMPHFPGCVFTVSLQADLREPSDALWASGHFPEHAARAVG